MNNQDTYRGNQNVPDFSILHNSLHRHCVICGQCCKMHRNLHLYPKNNPGADKPSRKILLTIFAFNTILARNELTWKSHLLFAQKVSFCKLETKPSSHLHGCMPITCSLKSSLELHTAVNKVYDQGLQHFH